MTLLIIQAQQAINFSALKSHYSSRSKQFVQVRGQGGPLRMLAGAKP
jgi:hypothetical protein